MVIGAFSLFANEMSRSVNELIVDDFLSKFCSLNRRGRRSSRGSRGSRSGDSEDDDEDDDDDDRSDDDIRSDGMFNSFHILS